ncbi:MAG: hypothetical protein ACJ8KO_06750 [Sulfurifustaceae bacterium]
MTTNLPFAFTQLEPILVWSLVGTLVLTTILYGSQGLGLSRLSLPFLVGTLFSGNRRKAMTLGFTIYIVGGFLFGFLYFLIMAHLREINVWMGALLGTLHGLFLLTVVLPVLPNVHPRMATEYDGPSGRRRLEPPGFLGLNYGYRTPLSTLIGHAVYGAILGAGFATSLGS